MLSLLQLLLAVCAIYSALKFPEETKLLVPLICLLLMLLISQIEKSKNKKKIERESFLKEEIGKIMDKDSATIKDQNFFTIESLLWPKNELLLIDAVHSIFKDLGFKVSPGVNYHSVDRIVKIPNTDKTFGVEIMRCEGETENNHPKLLRALEFEKEKREKEKTLIIASTHIHLPLADRAKTKDISEEVINFLNRHHISFITAYQLYELWQRAKGGENDIFGVFQKLHAHSGGIFFQKEISKSSSHSTELSLQ